MSIFEFYKLKKKNFAIYFLFIFKKKKKKKMNLDDLG